VDGGISLVNYSEFKKIMNYGDVKNQTIININKVNGNIVGGISGEYNPSVKDFYRNLLVYLESKRVLFNPGAVEQKEHCIASVLEMKQTLASSVMGMSFTDKELQPIRDIIEACNNYLDKVGIFNGHGFIIDHQDWEWFNMSPNGALGSLRMGFRSVIENIERDYGLKYNKEIR
jgi:hypothetical protein